MCLIVLTELMSLSYSCQAVVESVGEERRVGIRDLRPSLPRVMLVVHGYKHRNCGTVAIDVCLPLNLIKSASPILMLSIKQATDYSKFRFFLLVACFYRLTMIYFY